MAPSHLIGYLGEITSKQVKSGLFPDAVCGDLIGQWGLENQWQSDLGGVKGGRYLEVDALGEEIRPLYNKESVAGNNLITTLDWKLQQVAQEALKGKSGAVSGPQTYHRRGAGPGQHPYLSPDRLLPGPFG